MSAAWWLVADVVCIGLQQVKGWEQEDPDQIDEVPEQARVLDPVREPLRVRLPELGARSPEIGVHRQPGEDVKHVQPGQGEIQGEEVVGAGKESELELVAVFEVL